MCRKSMRRGGESLGGSGLEVDHTCEQQGADEERGVQPSELPNRQRRRTGERTKVQVVAVDWIFSFRIKCVGLEPIFGSYDVTENRAVLNILEGQ